MINGQMDALRYRGIFLKMFQFSRVFRIKRHPSGIISIESMHLHGISPDFVKMSSKNPTKSRKIMVRPLQNLHAHTRRVCDDSEKK